MICTKTDRDVGGGKQSVIRPLVAVIVNVFFYMASLLNKKNVDKKYRPLTIVKKTKRKKKK